MKLLKAITKEYLEHTGGPRIELRGQAALPDRSGSRESGGAPQADDGAGDHTGGTAGADA